MQVFLSYSSEDEKAASQLRSKLRDLGLKVWDPAVDLPRGANWLLETGRALERADGLVFLFSEASAQSPWARREVEYAIAHPRYEDRVVSVKLSPKAELPWILERLPVVNATGDFHVAAKQIASAFRWKPSLRGVTDTLAKASS